MNKIARVVYVLLFLFSLTSPNPAKADLASSPTYLIILVADGQGANHQSAANLFQGSVPDYQLWPDKAWLTTFPVNGSYDPNLAWSDFNYVKSGYPDSAAAATTLFTGRKTANGRISVLPDGTTRLTSLGDIARRLNLGLGVVTSSFISDATPSTLIAHNVSRVNYFSLVDEALWGDPQTTGLASAANHGGAVGSTFPPVDVWLGAGHPTWNGETYITNAIRNKLLNESGTPGAFTYVERISGQPDGGARLLQAANPITVTRMAGLFGVPGGGLGYQLSNGSGNNPENPTLVEMANAALIVLNRNPNGFVLLIESGEVDHSAHNNNLDQEIGEELTFFDVVKTVTDWVDSPTTNSTWENTLVLATADHETGYLTAGPGILPDNLHPIGPITPSTLALEKLVSGTPNRASWEDTNSNNLIDNGEKVYWAWNSGTHTKSLVPFYAHGLGAGMVKCLASKTDPVRGKYFDNSQVFDIASSMLARTSACIFHQSGQDYVNGQNGTKYLDTSGNHGAAPWNSDTVAISFSVSYTSTDQAHIYYTNDGSNPGGSRGTPTGTSKVLTCQENGFFGQPAERVFSCQGIPPQNTGSIVHYILETSNSVSNKGIYANSISCSVDTCAQVYSYTVRGPATLFLTLMSAYIK